MLQGDRFENIVLPRANGGYHHKQLGIEGNLASLHVVLTEDEYFMRNLIIRLPNEPGGGKNVTPAEDGAKGIAKITHGKKRIDLVVCDLEMPNVDGFQLVRKLRDSSDPAHAQIPVLILTGHSTKENIQDAVNLSIQGFLEKPISKQMLESWICAALTSPPIDFGLIEV